jgi:hypothetical protein
MGDSWREIERKGGREERRGGSQKKTRAYGSKHQMGEEDKGGNRRNRHKKRQGAPCRDSSRGGAG